MACNTVFRDADVLVVDVQALRGARVPDVYGLLALPLLKILFLGAPEDAKGLSIDDVSFYRALETVGFLFKDGPVARLIHAIPVVASGVSLCEAKLVKRLFTMPSERADPRERAGHLSGREIEILKMIADGGSNKEIASALFISENTVKTHVSRIMTKLDLGHRTELVKYAFTERLVSPETPSNN